MILSIYHPRQIVMCQKLHGLNARHEETRHAHRAWFKRGDERVSSHVVHIWMPLLKGIDGDHFGMMIASEVRKEHCVSALRKNAPVGVDEHGAHAIITCPRRSERLPTRNDSKMLVNVMRRFG